MSTPSCWSANSRTRCPMTIAAWVPLPARRRRPTARLEIRGDLDRVRERGRRPLIVLRRWDCGQDVCRCGQITHLQFCNMPLTSTFRAETVGFEPTEECKPLSTLAGWCTRPNYATSPVFVSNHIYRPGRHRIANRLKSRGAHDLSPLMRTCTVGLTLEFSLTRWAN